MTVVSYDQWIGGRWRESASGRRFAVRNPIDDSVIAQAAHGSPVDVNLAVTAAQEAFRLYSQTTPQERETWLLNAADLLRQRSDDFIEQLIDEVGSPISKAHREITTARGILIAAAGAARRLSGKTLATDVPDRMSFSIRRPLGVIAGMTPFNVPLIKNIKHAAMPLATGNTFVLLPSEEAPGVAVLVARLFADAGLPDGCFNVVTGSGAEIGDVLTEHPAVRMVGFTGSTRVGAHVSELCGRHRKRVMLEMGGKNPLIVLADADTTSAVQAAVFGSFMYQGQICMASSRIYVEESCYAEFLERFVAAAANLQPGDLRDPSTLIGPIINPRQRDRIRSHLQDAVDRGATIHTGGNWTGQCCHATVLTGVNSEMKIEHEETFGPVTSVYRVASPEEALCRANDSAYGLSAAVYTNDLNLALQFSEQLQAGMVHINGATIQDEPHVPFGGVGDSGFGRESTDTDIENMTEWKWITLNRSKSNR